MAKPSTVVRAGRPLPCWQRRFVEDKAELERLHRIARFVYVVMT
ncbi:hypothetical protein [Roseateles sp.]|nr:hypothetical protein [Roseateles sp.]